MGQIKVSSTPCGFRACTSCRGVLETFTCEVDSLTNASMSQNRIKSYQSAITLFDSFRLEKQFILEWTASLDNIITFIAYLSLKGCTYITASSYISGLSFCYKINGWEDSTQAFVVRKLLKSYSKCNSSKDLREPITLQMLKDFPNALKHVTLSNYEALLFSTAFSVAFFWFHASWEIGSLFKRQCNF